MEDNGLEENSGDGQVCAALQAKQLCAWTSGSHMMVLFDFVLSQEDVEASLDNLQDVDITDTSVLDEAEIDNGSVADCVEDDDADNLPESPSDSRELVEGDMKALPEQLQEQAVGNLPVSLECILNVCVSSTNIIIDDREHLMSVCNVSANSRC